MTSASRETDSGAALRASVISAFRSAIRYWSSGAMLGYGVLGPCACDCHTAHVTITSAEVPAAIILTIFRFICFLLEIRISVDDLPMCSYVATLPRCLP